MTRFASRSKLARLGSGALAAAVLAAATPTLARDEPQSPPLESETESPSSAPLSKGEQQLAKLLEGRVAGDPIDCMPPARNLPSTTIPGTAIVYGRPGSGIIYVQRTRNPDLIGRDTFLVSMVGQPTRLCQADPFNVVDRMLGLPIGAVVFDRFIPYTRIKPGN
jgi:hypothetical protein